MTERFLEHDVRILNLNTGDITGNQNPAVVGVSGTGVAGGYSNSVGSVNARNSVQTWRVNMREFIGKEWAGRGYKRFGMRLVVMSWSFHRQMYAGNSSRWLRVDLSGLPWTSSYEVKTRGQTSSECILPCLGVTFSTANTFVGTQGGNE
jgi:hypothetical protein